VIEAGVFAIPSAEWGEAIQAAVVTRSAVSAETLRAHCASRLAPFQIPKRILIVQELPRTPSGKLRRRALAGLSEVGGDMIG